MVSGNASIKTYLSNFLLIILAMLALSIVTVSPANAVAEDAKIAATKVEEPAKIEETAKTEEPTLILNGFLTQGSLVRGQLPRGSTVALNGESLHINHLGKFVFGFERDAERNHELTWVLPDGTKGSKSITLTAREYDIQRIEGVEEKYVTPPKKVTERIRNDSAKVARARTGLRDFDSVFTRFIWPAEGPITGVYGSQRVFNGEPKRPHYGVDVGAPEGTPVVAPAAGFVTLADDLYYSGNTLIVDHGMSVFSSFLHLRDMQVKVGDFVEKGQLIGHIGSTGRSTGPHLDWRINLGSMRLDPRLLFTAENQRR